ncbi:hypothetical protein ACVOMV_34440 [Mesorhizobium atlanticum]
MINRWTKDGEAKSVGLPGNAAEIVPEMFRRGIRPGYPHRPDLGA